MEFGILIGVSTQWNGNSKSQGPEGLGSVCWGCCCRDWASWLPEEVPAFLSSSSGSTDHRISHGCSWSLAPQSSSPSSAYSTMAFGLPRHRPCLLVGAVSQDNRPFGAH